MALRTAIYMRISTQDQSVESQRHELKRFVEARDDLELVGEYEDVISGVRGLLHIIGPDSRGCKIRWPFLPVRGPRRREIAFAVSAAWPR